MKMMQTNFLIFFCACMSWFALIGFVMSNDQHFVPFASPLSRLYFRRMRPFHPINDDNSLSPVLITRPSETIAVNGSSNRKQHASPPNPSENPVNSVNSTASYQRPNEKNRIFDSFNFWNVSDKPVMANGHVGFIPYGDTIYMNGLYNGYGGRSHRARIPNYANIQFESCSRFASMASDLNKLLSEPQCTYALDVFNGIFRTQANFDKGHFTVEQIQYAHRYYDRAIVNRIAVKRNQIQNYSNESFQIRLSQHSGGDSEDLTIKLLNPKMIANKSVIVLDATTTTLEDSTYVNELSNVSILYEKVPDLIELPPDRLTIEFIWIMVIGHSSEEVEKIFKQIQYENDFYTLHTNEWHQFWQQNAITVEGDSELSKTIQSSLYALASSLPSLNTSQPKSRFYGLSPSGLGLGKLLTDYQGHSFWDTEIWMHPIILLIEPQWSQELLNYRYFMRNAARDNAIKTGYNGYRYPWESAYTGRDVTQTDYPEIVKYQQHITADVAHALRQHFFVTHDLDWFRKVGCDLAYGTAQFWANRVQLNSTTNRYDINGIMGPDEDHSNINNNAFTNVVAALNLHFASYASCYCHQLDPIKYPLNTEWSTMAQRITLLYDQHLDYNPQYDGYNLNITIKQADVTLLGYPLQYTNIKSSTRRNNLKFYANVTRSNGPAMTWSMQTIGHLEVDSIPPTRQMFQRTYEPYVRRPFYVWNEYMDGIEDGAQNFITGAGGFLQLIIYGYAGIRIKPDSLKIEKCALPPNTTKLKLNGIAYRQTRLEIHIDEQNVRVNVRGHNNFNVLIDNIEQDPMRTIYSFHHWQKFELKPKQKTKTQSCSLPADTIDPFIIN